MGTRLTPPVLAVLQILTDAPGRETYGFDIVQESGLSGGTVYAILHRLEVANWVSSRWEKIDETKEGRRKRRYYKLTAAGFTALRDAPSSRPRSIVPGRARWAES